VVVYLDNTGVLIATNDRPQPILKAQTMYKFCGEVYGTTDEL